jgi:parallel beta-helix repeat protein
LRHPHLRLRLVLPVVASLLAFLHASPALTGTAALAPVADAYVYSLQPGVNFGAQAALRTDASPVMRSFIRFDVIGRSAATKIILRVYAETANVHGLDLRPVADNSWTEAGVNYNNQPALGPVLASSGPVAAGSWITFDVTTAVAADGPASFALTSESATAIRFSSREGLNPPQLVIQTDPGASPYVVTRTGDVYTAQSQSNGTTFSGTLKHAVESAAADLQRYGGGEIRFGAGTFDFGSDYFKFRGVNDITFTGAGMGVTVLRNDSSAAADTEPFNFEASDRITIRDLTVSAGGALRTTSDALDFDGGDDILIERVEVTVSRGRGIVFDGKDAPDVTGGTALRNVIRDCVISGGVLKSGIELLATGENRVEGCVISDVGGHGIHVMKASVTAAQPNKPSVDNVITGNTITNAGIDGVSVTSGHRNRILGNTITNSSDDVSARAGILISSSEGLACDSNVVAGNTATDDQPVKTQRHGLVIAHAQCTGNVVGDNAFAGNISFAVLDSGTGTVFTDTAGPTAPTALQATLTADTATLTWNASTDNYAVAGYRVRRDGVEIANLAPSTLTYSDAPVSSSVVTRYTVVAYDRAGNVSPESNSASVGSTPSGPITLLPAADAYVYALQPGINYAANTALRTDSSPLMRSFLRFDVNGRAGFTQVILRVYAETGNALGLDLRAVADTSWTETGLTFDNQPAVGPVLASSGPIAAGTWLTFDVTTAVTADGPVSFALTSESATAIRLSSREGANPPQLVLSP